MMVTVSGVRCWTARRMSIPSPSSRRRSVRTRSKVRSATSCSASRNLVAVVTSYPSSWRMALIVTTTLSSSSTTRTLGASRIVWPFDRQRDHERRAASHAAAHAQRPAVPLHDPLRDPEPETGPLPRLRREEGLEYLLEDVLRDPLARVA